MPRLRVAALGAGLVLAVTAQDSCTRPAPREAASGSEAHAAIVAGDALQQAKLIKHAPPLYPPEAKARRVQGEVELRALIGKNGSIKELTVVKGHPLLIPAALAAVRRWIYQPVLLNGQPVEVYTPIVINFTLNQ